MADSDIRSLERRVLQGDVSDSEALSKLVQAKMRSGEKVVVYWKIRHKDGKFCSGVTQNTSSNGERRPFYTNEGKTWSDKTELFRFIKKATESRIDFLINQLKSSEVVEFRTVEVDKILLTDMLEQAEVEILRAEKNELEKKLAEMETRIAQKSGTIPK